MLTIKYGGRKQGQFIQDLIDLTKNRKEHVLFTSADFTAEEVERSELAKRVINNGFRVCKLCCAVNNELDEHAYCNYYRTYLLFVRRFRLLRPDLNYIDAENEAKRNWQERILPLLK